MSHPSHRGTTTECPLASLGRNTPSLNPNLYHHPLSSSPLNPQVYERTRKSPILQIKRKDNVMVTTNNEHLNQTNQISHYFHQKHKQLQSPHSSSSSTSNNNNTNNSNNLGNTKFFHLSQSSSSSVEKVPYGIRRNTKNSLITTSHPQMDSVLTYHERSSPSPKSYLLEDQLDLDHSSSNNDSQSEKYFVQDIKLMNKFYENNINGVGDTSLLNQNNSEQYYFGDNIDMCHYSSNNNFLKNSLVKQRPSSPSETSESDRYLLEQINHLQLNKQRNLDKSPFIIPRYHSNSPQNIVNGLSRICRYSPTFDQGYHTLVSPSPTGQQTPGPWNKKCNNTSRNTGDFDQLPDEVVLKIFSWLDNCELCKIARVSRRFEVLIWKPMLWRVIRLKNNIDGDRALKIIFKKLCRQSRSGNCVGVEHILLSDGCKITDKGMHLISRKCPELTHLQIQFSINVTNNSITNLLSQCSNVQHLDITGCTQITYLDTMPSLENQLSRKLLLQYLDLTDCSSITDNGLKIIVKNCPHLVFVYLRRCVQITDAGLKHIPNFCTALRELSISDCSNITDFGLYELAKLGATLRYLSVAKCDKISDAGLKVIVRRCYKLRYLNARGCEAVSDDSITVLAKSCPRLRALDIGKCDVSDTGLRALAESCPNLKKLGLRNCDIISDVGIQCIAYFCRGLQQLNIQDCQITIEGYRAVKKYCKRCVIEHTNPGFC